MVLGNLCLARFVYLKFVKIAIHAGKEYQRANKFFFGRVNSGRADLSLDMNGTTVDSEDRCIVRICLIFRLFLWQRVPVVRAGPAD